MCHFSRSRFYNLYYSVINDVTLLTPGCPIRISSDQSFLPAPRNFSQVSASFFAFWCLGIHQQPLTAWSQYFCFRCFSYTYFSIFLVWRISPQALFFICELYFTTLKIVPSFYWCTLEVFFLSLTIFKIASLDLISKVCGYLDLN